MASMNDLQGSAITITQTIVANNTTAVATIAAPGSARTATAVFGLVISANAAPGAATTGVLTDGTTTLTFEIPAAAYAPICFNFPSGHPWIALPATAVTLTVGAHGGTVAVCAALMTRTVYREL